MYTFFDPHGIINTSNSLRDILMKPELTSSRIPFEPFEENQNILGGKYISVLLEC